MIKQCSRCRVELSDENWSKGSKSRRYYFCKDCERFFNSKWARENRKNPEIRSMLRAYQNEWYRSKYLENSDFRNKKLHESRERYHILRTLIIWLLGSKCIRCGFSDLRALQFDHVNGCGSEDRKHFSRMRYLKNILESLEKGENKYQLLCPTCNVIKQIECEEHRSSRYGTAERKGKD